MLRKMLKRDLLEPDRFEYLSKEYSRLYELALSGGLSKDSANAQVALLLEHIAERSRAAQVRSTY